MISHDSLWHFPPPDLKLTSEAVHIWRVFIDQLSSPLEQWTKALSAHEQLKAERFHFERDRNRFIICRGILRIILGNYLGIEPHRLRLEYGSQGKPVLIDEFNNSTLSFNLSHSRGMALYAFTSNRRVGVDIEHTRNIGEIKQIAERFFSPQENAVLNCLPRNKRMEAFYNCWTRKEAYLKAFGCGLTQPLHQVNVSLAPGEPARLLSIGGDSQEASRWAIRELRPASGYIAALVVEGHAWYLRCWQWPSTVDT
jgi:4'-phosphopantetheinyl transferase